MGLFDSAAGELFGGADSGSFPGQAKVKNDDIFEQVFGIPLAMQAMQAAVSLGMSLSDLFGDAFLDKKALKKQQKKSPGTVFEITKKQGIDLDKLIPKLPDIFQKVQQKGIETFNATFEKLGQVPALAGIFDQAAGGPGPLQGKIDAAFNTMGEFALGDAARTGLLNNSVVQAKALAPLALQKAMFEVGQQNAKQQQALGFAGVPGLTGTNPIFNQAVPSAQSFVPGVNAAASLSGQLAMSDQQAMLQQNSLGLQASIFNTQMGQDLFGFAAGAGASGGFG